MSKSMKYIEMYDMNVFLFPLQIKKITSGHHKFKTIDITGGELGHGHKCLATILSRFSCFRIPTFHPTRNAKYTSIFGALEAFVYGETCCTLHIWSPIF